MPEPGHEQRNSAEAAINAQIALAKSFKGQSYFIPGNHDWAQGRPFGWDRVIRQEKYVENRLDSADVFKPDNGCPGPVKVDISEELMLILIDTQWFLHGWEKPNDEVGSCEFTKPLEVLQALDQMLERNAHRKIVVATHHPMFTYGEHGGVFKSKYYFYASCYWRIVPII